MYLILSSTNRWSWICTTTLFHLDTLLDEDTSMSQVKINCCLLKIHANNESASIEKHGSNNFSKIDLDGEAAPGGEKHVVQ